MLKTLQEELYNINPFVKVLMSAGEQQAKAIKNNENITEMDIIIHNTHGKDMRQYNQPTASEVAAIVTDYNDISEVRTKRYYC